ncbi:MAG: ribonuclease [Pseudonocardiales bacterium]|nr:ribonuclease [Pseudonocardiales bacterium]
MTADPEEQDASGEPEAPATGATLLLRTPRDGTPEPLTTPAELAAAAAGLAAGTGPVAIDAERASGYRYSQRAYLVQIRREGFGTVLIDPISLPDLSAIGTALSDAEWILHAATQDLPCLAEVGMRPSRLFDSELIGRLLGFERVALGTMVEQYLGIALEKGHSAADWSTRPLPHAWLEYAALDVELLIELREALLAELVRTGKTAWAEQECEAILAAPPPTPRVEPWRRISGIHSIRNRRQLAMARSLWEARDRHAAERDIAPGRILPDSAIMAAVKANPKSPGELLALPVFNGPRQRRLAGQWFRALDAGRQLAEADLPAVSQLSADPDAMPAPARWRDKDPQAALRLAAAKQVVSKAGAAHHVVSQNLLAGDVIRRLCWRPVRPLTEPAVRAKMAELGARPWQIDVLAAELTAALAAAPTTLPTTVPSTAPSTGPSSAAAAAPSPVTEPGSADL